MKLLTVVGARPQFIKASVVSRALRAQHTTVEILVHTGQHYDPNLSGIFFEELDIPPPDYQLGIGSETHGAQTGRMLEAIERVLLQETPQMVLVYGDTNSTLAGALAAVKLHVPVAHVEAGLRSFNRRMPEEINRLLTDHIAGLLFAPTETAVVNLQREGITPDKIHQVGDVMYDVARHYGARAESHSRILSRLGLEPKRYSLVTIHRAENTDQPDRLQTLAEALLQMASQMPVVLPLHPRTHQALARQGLLETVQAHVQLIQPLGYLDMVMLEKNARLIATDSGGVQKEAFFHRVPCVTLRDETEWIELLELGWNRLAPPTDSHTVVQAIHAALHSTPRPAPNLYGDGHSAERIVRLLHQMAARR
ncbi:MAG: non-hydrolyzing UDP-N-acetylglucosamine 2-epimerase [Chloroflexota bacterium]